MFWASFRPGKLSAYNHLLFGFGFWTPLVIFGLAGLTTSSAANWPETAYVPGTLLLAGLLWRWLYYNDDILSRGKVVLISVLMLIGVLLIDVMRFPAVFSWFGMEEATKQRTQLSQSYGWQTVREELRAILPTIDALNGADCTILLDNHARAGMVAWLLNEPYRVNVTANTRVNQYNLWNRETPPTKACLYVAKYDGERWQRGDIPVQVSLPEGDWLRMKLLEVKNPDHTVSWFGFYRPDIESGKP